MSRRPAARLQEIRETAFSFESMLFLTRDHSCDQRPEIVTKQWSFHSFCVLSLGHIWVKCTSPLNHWPVFPHQDQKGPSWKLPHAGRTLLSNSDTIKRSTAPLSLRRPC
ncbi:hypothetical protein BJX65DRAFT_112370 [Aspergillus insuetus]